MDRAKSAEKSKKVQKNGVSPLLRPSSRGKEDSTSSPKLSRKPPLSAVKRSDSKTSFTNGKNLTRTDTKTSLTEGKSNGHVANGRARKTSNAAPLEKTRKTSVDRRSSTSTPPPPRDLVDGNLSEAAQLEIDRLLAGEESDEDLWTGVQNEGPMYRVLAGNMTNLPPMSSKIVRIFTSSTFTDTTVERNALMEHAYPQLKEYCKDKYGLEFQVVDMRWGIRDEAGDDHMTAELCIQEIHNCKRVSLGPNFVLFLGHKYGYRPMQRLLPASEFEQILDITLDVDKEVLEKWYVRDDNCVPAVYVLRPISSVLVNINNKRLKSLMKQDQDTWWKTFDQINRTLRLATNQLVQQGKMTPTRAREYNISITELETTEGMLEASDANQHTLAFIRTLKEVDFTKIRKAGKYIDVDDYGAVNEEAQTLLKTLKDERLPKTLPSENILKYDISCGHERNVTMKDKHEYIGNFCDDFKNKIIDLIDRAVTKQNELSGSTSYREIRQHLHDCRTFSELFQGRDDVVERVKQYVLGDSSTPLVLYGESGCGKTSLLAKCASSVQSWKKRETFVIVRFLGTTPDSSTIIPLLTSLCQQLCFLYKRPTDNIPKDLLPLQNHLKTLLELSSEEAPVVVFLDSLDQLSGQDGAHQLAWLPGELPTCTKIVVSTLPRYYCLLDTLKGKLRAEENFIELSQLGEDLSTVVLESWLKQAKRKLTENQWQVVNEAIKQCNLPLFVRLVFKEVCRWSSYTPLETAVLGYTIEESIMKLLARIELTHGETIVSHALGYITASKSGVSETELEDLLSLDDTVLTDVYQYHVPPIRRIPPLLWTRIRNDLPRYLTEREADGLSVLNWFHRQFIDASRARYFKNLNFKSLMHRNMAEYFMGMWSGKAKPFKYTVSQKQLLGIKNEDGESDRLVPSQQLITLDESGNVLRYNLRALSELPFHLIKSHNFVELSNKVLFNYKWLHTKLKCMPLQALMTDFEAALEVVDDKEIRMLADALRLSSSALAGNPDMLGPHIVGRLLPYYTRSERIRSLIDQCDTEGLYDNALSPSYQCFHTPGGPLQYSFEGHPLSCYGIAITSDDRYLVSVSNRMIVWDLTNGVIFREIDPCIKSVMQCLVLDPLDRYAVALTRGTNEIVVFSLLSGDTKVLANPCSSKEPLLGVSVTKDCFCVWSSTEWCTLDIEASLETSVKRRCTSSPGQAIVHVEMKSENIYIIKGHESGHSLENMFSTDILQFNQAMVMNSAATLLYATVPNSKQDILVFENRDQAWHFSRTLAENTESIYSMTLSHDEGLLLATVQHGFKVWEVAAKQKSYSLNYPTNHRNFPQKFYHKPLSTMSKDNKYLIAALKTKVFVWKIDIPNPLRILEDHFERIVSLLSRSSWCSDIVLTSSLDKTVKCWNIQNVLESSYPLERMERPIEHIDVAEKAYVAAVVTRNQLGIFELETGHFRNKMKYSNKTTTVVTHAVITPDARYCISSEEDTDLGFIILWDLHEVSHVEVSEGQIGVIDMILTEDDSKILVFSKIPGKNAITCICREIPSFKEVFRFDYTFAPPVKKPLLTSNGLYLIVLSSTKTGQMSLKKFHSKTGVLLDSCTVRYPDFKGITDIQAIDGDDDKVVLVDNDKGNIFDLHTKQHVRSVARWNGHGTRCGRYGIYAPGTGGVEIMDLEDGKTQKVFLRRGNEGVHYTMSKFVTNDHHLLYYHSGHKSIRLFNVWGRRKVGLDGTCLAKYYLPAEVKVMSTTPGGGFVVIGTADGRVTSLTIADPRQNRGTSISVGREHLLSMRKQYHDAEFIQDESFKTVVRKDLQDFDAVVEEMLKIKNQGTDKADTLEEWRQEQAAKAMMEEGSTLHTLIKSIKKSGKKNSAEEALDEVDGPQVPPQPAEEPQPSAFEILGHPKPKRHKSFARENAPSYIASLLKFRQQQATLLYEEEQQEETETPAEKIVEEEEEEEEEEETNMHEGIARLRPDEGAIGTWKYATMGLIVNEIAMGDAAEEVRKERRARQEAMPSMGAMLNVSKVVARSRKFKQERNERERAANRANGQIPKSVTCTIS